MRKRIVDNHVLYGQNFVIEQLMKSNPGLMDYLHDARDEILEWWLITPFLAGLLEREGETVIAEYDCHWWGRTQSGQAIYMDSVIGKICQQLD
jgi:hypothetical protein